MEERAYASPVDPHDVMRLVQWVDETSLDMITARYVKNVSGLVQDRYSGSWFMSYSAKCLTNIQQMPLEVSSRSGGQQNYLVLNEGD